MANDYMIAQLLDDAIVLLKALRGPADSVELTMDAEGNEPAVDVIDAFLARVARFDPGH